MLQGQSHALVECTRCILDAACHVIAESLLAHAHGHVAVTVVSTHVRTTCKLRGCHVITSRYELLVALPSTDVVTLNCVVVNLAQSLRLMILELGAMMVTLARLCALLGVEVARVHLLRGVDLLVGGHVE